MNHNLNLYNIDKFLFNKDDISSILRSNGKSKYPGDTNILEMFLQEYHSQPKLYRISNESENDDIYFNWDILRDGLNNLFPDIRLLFSDTVYELDKDKEFNKQEIWKLMDGVFLQLEGFNSTNSYLTKYDLTNINSLVSLNLFLYKEEIKDLDKIIEIFNKSKLEKINSVSIGMVSYSDGSFFIKDFDITTKTTELTLLDEHYGDGFIDFNSKLLKRLSEKTKGLVLFHGAPGTGKSTYIRYLIRKLKEMNNNNNILYIPPTMVDTITDPNFINFISEWTFGSKGKNYLLIEDAEPLLQSRDTSRNIGITNLLNLTDGLLNDILNTQIIATFNTKISNIDDALLRSERLIARKEFVTLDIIKGKELAEKIGVDPNLIDKEMTLADIYALKNDNKPIIHNIDDKLSTKIGFHKN